MGAGQLVLLPSVFVYFQTGHCAAGSETGKMITYRSIHSVSQYVNISAQVLA